MGNVVRLFYIESCHCGKPHGFALLGNVGPWAVFPVGAVDDFVVNVGDIGNEADLNARPGEISAQNVVDQGGSAVPEVGRAIDGGAAEVDAEVPGLAHCKGSDLLSGSVVERKHSLTLG